MPTLTSRPLHNTDQRFENKSMRPHRWDAYAPHRACADGSIVGHSVGHDTFSHERRCSSNDSRAHNICGHFSRALLTSTDNRVANEHAQLHVVPPLLLMQKQGEFSAMALLANAGRRAAADEVRLELRSPHFPQRAEG